MTETTLQTKSNNAVETSSLGKKYGALWALKACNITVPAGSVSALVGPNGAGKTTLLKLLVSLNRPSTGTATVLGQTPSQAAEYLSEIGYVAQDVPLYKQYSVADHLAIGSHLDPHWDNELAIGRLNDLKIAIDRPVGKLSGGQRAQVGLAMALAKKPRLLLLDEPVAPLDPLARADFLTSLAQAVADGNGELTVVMSSHLLADLERVCDHLIILASGETQLCDDIEHALETHKLLVGAPGQLPPSDDYVVVNETRSSTTTHALVRLKSPTINMPNLHIRDVDIEQIVLAYMGQIRDEANDKRSGR